MNKKIILSAIVASTIITNSASAASTEDRLLELEKIIKAQQKEINLLKSSVEDVEEIDERLEEVETRSFTDKIKFGLGLKTDVNNIDTKFANGSKPNHQDPVFRTKLNLNMKSEISDNLKFVGRLSMHKNWGDSVEDSNAGAYLDTRQGRIADNKSELFVERAYADWTMTSKDATLPLTLSLGRQATTDGPSHNIKEGITRKGTYDALTFDANFDGAILTANLDKLVSNTTLRLGYGVLNNSSSYNPDMRDGVFYGAFLEKTFDSINKEHLFHVFYTEGHNIVASPNLKDKDKDIGNTALYGAFFEILDVYNFDLFAHYARSKAKPNGSKADFSSVGLPALGLMNVDSTSLGKAFWLGAKYNFNKTWAMGAEYNKGDKNWFNFTSGAHDPLDKLATRGDVIEVYISKKINKNASIRLGYVDINYDYTNSGLYLGTPADINSATAKATNAIKEQKNAYLSFNILF